MKKRFLCMLLAAVLAMASTTTAFAASKFNDVKSGNWAEAYINKLVEKGGIAGYPDGTFKPSAAMTAAEFVKTITAIVNIGGIDKVEGDKHWASGYMNFAENVFKIVPEGMFERSDWDKPISREKMAVIMERTAQLFYEEETTTDEAKLNAVKSGIKDYNKVCDYCKDYIVQAVSRGLINGYQDGTFGPQKTATRAEAATMIVRLIEPAYRVAEIKTEAVAEGTDLSDYIKTEGYIEIIADMVDKYVVLENGDKFNLKFLYSNDENFYVEYKLYGMADTLDKNGRWIDSSSPTKDPYTLGTQAFDGKLQDTAYFVFIEGHDRIAYIIPNTFIE